jgi:predicted enzyme related to lactoylglutathione lyase
MGNELAARLAFPRLVVRDLERQAQFYRSVIGYGEGQFIRATINGRPVAEIILAAPDGKVELILLRFEDGPAPSPSGVMLGFFTHDLDAFEARLLAAGGQVAQPIGPLETPAGTWRFALYADPEGYWLEVMQRSP